MWKTFSLVDLSRAKLFGMNSYATNRTRVSSIYVPSGDKKHQATSFFVFKYIALQKNTFVLSIIYFRRFIRNLLYQPLVVNAQNATEIRLYLQGCSMHVPLSVGRNLVLRSGRSKITSIGTQHRYEKGS